MTIRDDLIIKDKNNQKNQKEEFEPVKHSYEYEAVLWK